jgi:PIN domain nuclease of toxin-antitoxin system
MKYLLDTSVWLWSVTTPLRISEEGRNLLDSGHEELYLSAVSAWEISIKWASGKLHLPDRPARYVPKFLAVQGIQPLPITHTHALAVSELALHHRDPFDRLLIVQAQIEDMTILTADRAFKEYDVQILWCGH